MIYGGNGFWALEVKNTATVRPQDLRGLKSFRHDYPECEAALLYRGTERLRIDGIWCLPGEEFLRQLRPSAGLFDQLPWRDHGRRVVGGSEVRPAQAISTRRRVSMPRRKASAGKYSSTAWMPRWSSGLTVKGEKP